jgi:hypothetical protein
LCRAGGCPARSRVLVLPVCCLSLHQCHTDAVSLGRFSRIQLVPSPQMLLCPPCRKLPQAWRVEWSPNRVLGRQQLHRYRIWRVLRPPLDCHKLSLPRRPVTQEGRPCSWVLGCVLCRVPEITVSLSGFPKGWSCPPQTSLSTCPSLSPSRGSPGWNVREPSPLPQQHVGNTEPSS